MSLQDFSHNWIPIIQAAISLLGLCSLGLVWWQIRRTNYWNKLSFLNNFIISSSSIEVERKVLTLAKALGIDLNINILTEADVDKIWNSESDDAFYAIKEYLNNMENLCVGIRFGIAHPDIAYAVHAARIISTYRIFELFIRRIRLTQQSDEIYKELQTVANEFLKRQSQELASKQSKSL